jgi:thioredoxin reductase (NADPH)
MTNAAVTAIQGGEHLQTVAVRDIAGGATSEVGVNGLFVCIGLTPATDLLHDLIELDPEGRAPVGPDMQTRRAGLFAVGAIRAGSPDQAITAAGDGVTAALAAFHMLSKDKQPRV